MPKSQQQLQQLSLDLTNQLRSIFRGASHSSTSGVDQVFCERNLPYCSNVHLIRYLNVLSRNSAQNSSILMSLWPAFDDDDVAELEAHDLKPMKALGAGGFGEAILCE